MTEQTETRNAIHYHANIYCEQWAGGPTYDYGNAYDVGAGNPVFSFTARLKDAIDQCDTFARKIARIEITTDYDDGSRERETFTRAQVEETWF